MQTQRNTQKHINHQYKCIAQSINILLFQTNRSRSICKYGTICIYKVATYTTANVENSIADLFSSYRLDGTESMVALPRLYSHDFQCSFNLIEVNRDNFGAHHIEVLNCIMCNLSFPYKSLQKSYAYTFYNLYTSLGSMSGCSI